MVPCCAFHYFIKIVLFWNHGEREWLPQIKLRDYAVAFWIKIRNKCLNDMMIVYFLLGMFVFSWNNQFLLFCHEFRRCHCVWRFIGISWYFFFWDRNGDTTLFVKRFCIKIYLAIRMQLYQHWFWLISSLGWTRYIRWWDLNDRDYLWLV